jgi:hypothetical protein
MWGRAQIISPVAMTRRAGDFENKVKNGEPGTAQHTVYRLITIACVFTRNNSLIYFLPRRASSSSRSMCLLCDGTPTRINSSI